jgi:hypothetical protein
MVNYILYLFCFSYLKYTKPNISKVGIFALGDAVILHFSRFEDICVFPLKNFYSSRRQKTAYKGRRTLKLSKNSYCPFLMAVV